ncbi:MAG: hypothetical protein ACW96X_13200 [Promethearchaeota archaeon]|jgi:hypothetical protein
MTKEPVISYDELMDELENHRSDVEHPRPLELTEYQRKFIIKCRSGERPVPYDKMVKLWKKAGWPERQSTSMRRYWYQIREELNENSKKDSSRRE